VVGEPFLELEMLTFGNIFGENSRGWFSVDSLIASVLRRKWGGI